MDNIKSENTFKPVRDGGLFSVSADLRVAEMQKMHALNQNGLLQEELDWQDISYIADNLYISGHIEHHKLEQILDKSQSRIKAVDSLVDAIIGNQSAVSAFMRILESENRFSYMAERIRSTAIASGGVLTNEKQHPPVMIWEPNQIQNNKRKYLSIVAIGDFEPSVWLKPMKRDSTKLVFEPKYPIFFEPSDWSVSILSSVYHQPILEHHKTEPCEYPTAQKRMKMQESGSEAVKEKKMVKSLRIAIVGQKLWSHVSKHLDREFKETFKGPPEDEE